VFTRAIILAGLVFWISFDAMSVEMPTGVQDVGITEHLGNEVQIKKLNFTDEKGEKVHLSDYFKKNHPVILVLVYYKCPHLCNLLLNGLVMSLANLTWTVGDQFEVVAVSVDPHETPLLAKDKKANYLDTYHRIKSGIKVGTKSDIKSDDGWHFLVGEEDQIRELASEIGFNYKYDEEGKQYAHAASLFILTPSGRIARYIYGVTYDIKQLRLSLLEAANGKIGNVVDQILLFCFHFDPSKNSYTLSVWRVVQAILALQVIVLFFVLLTLWKKDRDFKPKRPA
jgi:protein SCO1/2